MSEPVELNDRDLAILNRFLVALEQIGNGQRTFREQLIIAAVQSGKTGFEAIHAADLILEKLMGQPAPDGPPFTPEPEPETDGPVPF